MRPVNVGLSSQMEVHAERWGTGHGWVGVNKSETWSSLRPSSFEKLIQYIAFDRHEIFLGSCIRNYFYIYCEYGAQNIYEAVTFPECKCMLIKPKTICIYIYIYKSTLLWDPLLQDTPSTAAPESTSPADTMATSPEDAEMPGTSMALLPRSSSVPLFSDEAPPLPAPSETPEFEEMPVSKHDLDDILIAFKYLTEVPEVFKYLPESDDESVEEVEKESETWFYWIQFVTWVSFPILSSKNMI